MLFDGEWGGGRRSYMEFIELKTWCTATNGNHICITNHTISEGKYKRQREYKSKEETVEILLFHTHRMNV